MRCAFLVVYRRSPAPLPPHLERLLDGSDAPHRAFPTGHHRRWGDENDRCHLAAWQEHEVTGTPSRWAERDREVAVVTGELRQVGRPWGLRPRWPEVLLDLASPIRAEDLDRLGGIFAGVHLDLRRGGGAIVCDPLGLRGLYHGETDDLVAIASHPTLAALALAPERATPERDALAVSSLAFSRHRIVERTGYAGVRLLPMGAWVELDGRHAPRVVERPAVLAPTDEMRAATTHELYDRVEAVLQETVMAAPTYPADGCDVDLTGGKDSRLVLAVFLSSGTADQVRFRTDGGMRVPDVAVAHELATALGLHHEFALMRPADRYTPTRPEEINRPWRDQASSFVEATAGMNNVWWRKYPGGPSRPIRIGGLLGEALRGTRWLIPSTDAAVGLVERRFGRLGLLRPDAERWCREQLASGLRAGPGTPNDQEHANQIRTQIRQNFGPREDLSIGTRLLPLYSIDAIRVAFALGAEERASEQIHRVLMRRAAPLLESHRFAGPGWAEPRVLPDVRPDHDRSRTANRDGQQEGRRDAAQTTTPGRGPVTSIGHIARDHVRHDEVVTLLADLAADHTNPAWDHVDRDRTASAIARYDELVAHERMELHGAATAALWLGGNT